MLKDSNDDDDAELLTKAKTVRSLLTEGQTEIHRMGLVLSETHLQLQLLIDRLNKVRVRVCVCVWRATCLLAHTYSMQALPDAEDEEEEGEEEEDVVEVPAPKVARTK